MLRSIGVFVFAGKAMGLSPCNNYDLKDGSRIEVGSASYMTNNPSDIFGNLKGCRMTMGTYEQCYTSLAFDVASKSLGGTICNTCIDDYFRTGPNAADADACVDSCIMSSCTGSCDQMHLNQIASVCGLAEPFPPTTTTTTTTEEPTTTTTTEESTTTEEETTSMEPETTSEEATTASGAMTASLSVAFVGVLSAMLL